MLVLVGHGERSFSLQINITKDITAIVRRVKDFSMISFPRIFLFYGILITYVTYVYVTYMYRYQFFVFIVRFGRGWHLFLVLLLLTLGN